MSSCKRAGRLIGGCKFSPRFDLGPSEIGSCNGAAGGVVALAETMRAKTYVRDVCERCGKTIER